MIALIAALAMAADPSPLLRDPPATSRQETQPPLYRRPPGGVPAPMPVYAVYTDGKGVTVDLRPAGCNSIRSDYTVAVSRSADRPTLLFARRSDTTSLVVCKAMPRTVAFTWTYDDLGLKPGQPFSLANPLVTAP